MCEWIRWDYKFFVKKNYRTPWWIFQEICKNGSDFMNLCKGLKNNNYYLYFYSVWLLNLLSLSDGFPFEEFNFADSRGPVSWRMPSLYIHSLDSLTEEEHSETSSAPSPLPSHSCTEFSVSLWGNKFREKKGLSWINYGIINIRIK